MKSLAFILGLIAAVTIGIGPALFILFLALIWKLLFGGLISHLLSCALRRY